MQPPTTARPMTAVRGAGYTSVRANSGSSFDPLNQAKHMSNFQAKDETAVEYKIKVLEKKITSLLHDSVMCAHRKEHNLALEKAKVQFDSDCARVEQSRV